MDKIVNILEELCRIPTAFGAEDGMLDYIEKYCDGRYPIIRDGMGNITIEKKSGRENAVRVMLCASVDAEGFIVNYIEEDGFLRVTKLGGISCISSAYTELVSEDGVHGFILPQRGAEVKDGDASSLYIDIGAKNRKDAEVAVRLGCIFARIPSLVGLRNNRVGGDGAARRMPVAILLRLLEMDGITDADLYFSFTVQGAIRDRGAKVASFDIHPDYCICIEPCDSLDVPGATARGEAKLCDGAIILAKTRDYCAPVKLRDELSKLAEDNDIKHKVCVYPEKTTSAAVISAVGKGCCCAELCFAARGLGTGAEIFDLSDVKAVYELLTEYVSGLKA